MAADDTDADRRYRGILTPDDEAFLLGETESDPATNRDTRYRIRNRLRRGLLDLDLLYEHLPAGDRSRVFGDLYEDRPDAFVSAIALYYLSAWDLHTRDGRGGDAVEAFERLVEAAVQIGDQKRGYLSDVEVTIDVESRQPDPAEVRRKIRDGDGTSADFFYLGFIDRRELLQEAIEADRTLELIDTFSDEHVEITPGDAEQLLDHDRGL